MFMQITFVCILAAPWQEETKELDSVLRDQKTIGQRIEKIESKMDRLAKSLETEGKTYSAGLLTKAVAAMRDQSVKEKIEALAPAMKAQAWDSLAGQDQVLKSLEDVYAILLDRNDLEKLAQQLDLIRQGLNGLKDLSDAERKIRERTSELNQNEQLTLERARDSVKQLEEEQKKLSTETKDASHDQPAGEQQASQALEAAKAAQQSALAKNRDGIPERMQELTRKLDGLIERERRVTEGLRHLADKKSANDPNSQPSGEHKSEPPAGGKPGDKVEPAKSDDAAKGDQQAAKDKPGGDQGKPADDQGKPAGDQGKPAGDQGKPAGDQGKPADDHGKPGDQPDLASPDLASEEGKRPETSPAKELFDAQRAPRRQP